MNEAAPPAHPAPCCCHTEHFTERELGILRQVAVGATNDEVAHSMNISGHTVAGHLRAMLNRSSARNRAELVARAYAAGILVPQCWPPRLTGRRCLQVPGSALPVPQPRSERNGYHSDGLRATGEVGRCSP